MLNENFRNKRNKQIQNKSILSQSDFPFFSTFMATRTSKNNSKSITLRCEINTKASEIKSSFIESQP